MPDNYSQWEAHEAELERRLEQRPVCRYCGEHIQGEHYFYIEGCILCEECLNDKYRRIVTDDYYF